MTMVHPSHMGFTDARTFMPLTIDGVIAVTLRGCICGLIRDATRQRESSGLLDVNRARSMVGEGGRHVTDSSQGARPMIIICTRILGFTGHN